MGVNEIVHDLNSPQLRLRREAVETVAGVPDLWALHVLRKTRENDKAEEIRNLADKGFRVCENAMVRRILPLIPAKEEEETAAAERVEIALAHEDPAVRSAGVTAVALAKNVGFIDRIVELAHGEKDARVLVTCLKALGLLGSKREAIEILRFSTHESEKVRATVVVALSMVGSAYAWVLLARLAVAARGSQRTQALFFLESLGSSALGKFLSYMLVSKEKGIAEAAIEVCALVDDETHLPILRHALTKEGTALARRSYEIIVQKAAAGSPGANEILGKTEAPVVEVLESEADAPSFELTNSQAQIATDQIRAVEARTGPSVSSPSLSITLETSESPSSLLEEHSPDDEDESFIAKKKALLTQSVRLTVPEGFSEESPEGRFAAFAAALAIFYFYLLVVLGVTNLALVVYKTLSHQGAVDYQALVHPLVGLGIAVWLLWPAGKFVPGVRPCEATRVRLKRLADAAAEKVGYELPVAIRVVPWANIEIVSIPFVPFLPFGGRRVLLLGALLFDHLSTQELKALIGRQFARCFLGRSFKERYLLQLRHGVQRLTEAYRFTKGVKRLFHPVRYLVGVFGTVFLTPYVHRSRQLDLAADTIAAGTFGANIVKEAVTIEAVLGRLTTDLVSDVIAERQRHDVPPVNVYQELRTSLQWKIENGTEHVREKLLDGEDDRGSFVPPLKERLNALRHGEARRTRVRKPVWTLLDDQTALEKQLSMMIWKQPPPKKED